jgi:hypothetical protein
MEFPSSVTAATHGLVMSQPAHKSRIGTLQVAIWRNHGEKGNWYSVIPSRGYKQS